MELVDLHYLSIDPGEKISGWAAFRENGTDIIFGEVRGGPDAFMDWLEGLDPAPKEIIFEEYRINPAIGHGFSEAVTIQVIGMIKRYAKKAEIPWHAQSNQFLNIGLRQVGMYDVYYERVRGKERRKKHVDDQISAYAHGVYYLVKKGIRESRLQK